MKLFGEYLLEEKIVTEEILLKALFKQMQTVPCMPEVICEHKLLNESEVLSILVCQAKMGLDFKAAAIRLGLWNKDIESKTQKVISNKKVPLGKILFSDGHLSLENLTKSFDEFISLRTKELAQPNASPQEDRSISDEYFEFLDDDMISLLKGHIDTLDAANIPNLIAHLKSLKGAARFSGAMVSERLVTEAEILFVTFLNKNKQTPKELQKLRALGLEILDVLTLIKQSFLKNRSEIGVDEKLNQLRQSIATFGSKTNAEASA